jgi:hypothetical protein
MKKVNFIAISKAMQNGKTAILSTNKSKWIVNWSANNSNEFLGSIIKIDNSNKVTQRIFFDNTDFFNVILRMSYYKNLIVIGNYSFVTNLDTLVKENYSFN